MGALSATVEININANQSAALEYIVPIDLVSIFTGYGPLPKVIGIRNQTGAWDAADQTRTVLLADGSSAQELLTKYEHPHYFSDTVSGFTGVLRMLTTSADGEWWLKGDAARGKTHVR